MIDTPIIISPINSGNGNTGNTSGSGNKTILHIPTGLENLKPGSVVEAIVIGKDANNNSQLNIKNNALTVSSKLPLETQSHITLKIIHNTANVTGNADFKAQLVLIDGKTPLLPKNAQGQTIPHSDILRAVLPASSHKTPPTAPPTTAPTTQATLLNISKGAIIDAVITKPNTGATSYLPPTHSTTTTATQAYGGNTPVNAIQKNDTLQLHVLSTQSPSKNNATPTPAQSTPSAYNSYQRTDSSSNHSQNTRSQDALSAFASRNTQNPTANSITPLTSHKTFTGTVIGTEKSGDVVISSPLGTLKLSLSTPLAQNSTLTLEVLNHTAKQNIPPPNTAESQLVAHNYKHSLTAHNSAFEQLFSAMAALEKTTGKPLIKDIFPNAKNQAAAKLLWFVFNAQNGSAASWLGTENVNQLNKSSHKNLLKRLETAFGQIKALSNEPNPAGFHTIVFPFYDGEDLQYGRFYTRQNQASDAASDIRFLVEIDFDTWGEFQLDGFIHNIQSAEQNTKQFDLYIRSKKPLEDNIRSDIITLFKNAQETSGLKGNISFQTVEDFPISPDADIDDSHDEGEIIV